jgi:hypothetical protein
MRRWGEGPRPCLRAAWYDDLMREPALGPCPSRAARLLVLAVAAALAALGCVASHLPDAAAADAGRDASALDASALDASSPDAPCVEWVECCRFQMPGCRSDAECTDPESPFCVTDISSSACAAHPACARMCASPGTLIATPNGDRAIADLVVGDLVYSADEGALRAVPLALVARRRVSGHRVVRVVLATGAVLEISASHPTADGRWFAQLSAGDTLDGAEIASAELVPYAYEWTYDILPASDTGTYVAGGVLIGSTLSAPDAPLALAMRSGETP